MNTRKGLGWVAVILTTALTACNSAGTEALGGDGLPVQNASESYGHESAELTGIVTLEPNGCWTIDIGDGKRLLVFPEGFTKDDSGMLMRSSDGAIDIGSDDEITAMGGVVAASDFPGIPDGYWGGYLTFCKPPIEEFVVVDEFFSIDF